MEKIIELPQQNNSKKLYEASIRGSVTMLNTLLQKDPLILDRISLTSQTETPLHVSSLLGHIEFTKALLHHKPDLLSQLDNQKQSPLHLASANGHTEIVQALLIVNKDVCLAPDQYGRVPLHLAAMRGRLGVIKEFVIRALPESLRMKVNGGDTVLHLCVRYNHLEALQMLVEAVGKDEEFLNSVDNDGNTIFQLAALLKQVETIKYLATVPEIKVEVDALAKMVTNYPLDPQTIPIPVSTITSATISNTIVPKPDQNNATPQQPGVPVQYQQPLLPPPYWTKIWGRYLDYQGDWLENARGNIMLVATVIATMAFQVSINPPGGLWDRDAQKDCPENAKPCEPGTSILASTHDTTDNTYHYLIICNTISFSASLGIILLLVSGFPLRRRFFGWVLMVAMCFTIFFMAATYMISASLVGAHDDTIDVVARYYWWFWAVLLGLVVLFYIINVLIWLLRSLFACTYRIVLCSIKTVMKLYKLMIGKHSTSRGPPGHEQPAPVV